MTADETLNKVSIETISKPFEEAWQICGGSIMFKIVTKSMEEYAQLKAEQELKRLYDWLIDENREPAQTFFTAGELRNVAKEIEFKLYKESKQ